MKQSQNNEEDIEIDPEVLYINPDFPLYTRHRAKANQKHLFGKCFQESQIIEQNLTETLAYNEEVLDASSASQYAFPDKFLFIHKVYLMENGFTFATDQYKKTLLQYIEQKNHLEEKQALQIFEQIVKSVYSVYKLGYWSRNIRPEHFVKVKKQWKMESLVFDHTLFNQTKKSEYFLQKQYYPPEAYNIEHEPTDEELDQRMIWDLGCLLIHLLLGNHKLKSKSILEKFKDRQFSFESIKAKKGQSFSLELKQYLGKMCHYNQEKRMKIKEFFLIKFFSPQVSADYQKFLESKQKRVSKIFLPKATSSVRQCLSQISSSDSKSKISSAIYKPIKPQEEPPNPNQIKEEDQSEFQDQMNVESIISNKKTKINNKSKVYLSNSKKDQKKEFDFLSEENISPNYKQIVKIILSQIAKCKLILLEEDQFLKIENLFRVPKIAMETILFTKYLLYFASLAFLEKLSKLSTLYGTLDEYGIQLELFKKFTTKDTFIHKKIQEMIKKQIQILEDKLVDVKRKMLKIDKLLVLDDPEIQKTIRLEKKADFQTIKGIYRQFIFYNVYGKVVEHYNQTKKRQLAEIGMRLTFSLAIDKLYIPKNMKKNFQGFFAWKKQYNPWISEFDFKQYVSEASEKQLIADSRYIIDTYYDY